MERIVFGYTKFSSVFLETVLPKQPNKQTNKPYRRQLHEYSHLSFAICRRKKDSRRNTEQTIQYRATAQTIRYERCGSHHAVNCQTHLHR